MKQLLLLLIPLFLLTACVTEDVPNNNRQGNFESLWRVLDEHYCFLIIKSKLMGLTGIKCAKLTSRAYQSK